VPWPGHVQPQHGQTTWGACSTDVQRRSVLYGCAARTTDHVIVAGRWGIERLAVSNGADGAEWARRGAVIASVEGHRGRRETWVRACGVIKSCCGGGDSLEGQAGQTGVGALRTAALELRGAHMAGVVSCGARVLEAGRPLR
jgi:hypothetical protein